MITSTMKLFLGRITGCLKLSSNSCELPSLPPTWMSPSLSRKGSRRNRVLDFLISDFFAFANWRSSLEYALWIFCNASISLGNALLCISLRMVFSALSNSSTLRGLASTFVAFPSLLVPSSVIPCLGLRRSIQAIDFFSRCHSENRLSLVRKSSLSSTSVYQDSFNFRVVYRDIV